MLAQMIQGTISGMMDSYWNKRQLKENQTNRVWQTQMANTAFQRAVDDMRKAGLNPVLAAGKQAVTPSPSGSGLTGIGSSMAAGSQAASSAREAKTKAKVASASIKQLEAQAAKVGAERDQEVLKAALLRGAFKAYSEDPVLRDTVDYLNLLTSSGANRTGSSALSLSKYIKESLHRGYEEFYKEPQEPKNMYPKGKIKTNPHDQVLTNPREYRKYLDKQARSARPKKKFRALPKGPSWLH